MDKKPKMEKIVFFGKGGIGKSTLSANISAIYAQAGRRVLHVGCDPKHDSTVLLVERPYARTVLVKREGDLAIEDSAEFVTRSRLGLDCVEAGGPEPGVGCAGRGISKMIDVFAKERLLERGRYDVTIFDVLGDVVCGGFAAPLRRGFGEKIVIVVSEEIMSLYAANNIAHAVRNYAGSRVALCGLLANMRDPAADLKPIERFARLIGTSVIGSLGRDAAFREGERLCRCLVELSPRPKVLSRLESFAERLLKMDARRLPVPVPLEEEEFYEASRLSFPARPARRRSASAPSSAAPAPSGAARAKTPRRAPLPDATHKDSLPAAADENVPEVSPETRWMMWTWGVEGQWREFFADAELWLNSARLAMNNVAYILHKELECHYVEARTDDGSACFFNYPWPEHCVMGLSASFSLRAQGCRQVVTDIRDGDIIMGGASKLESAMDRLARDPGDTELAVVLNSCPPLITGDDISSVVERFQKKTGIPTVMPDHNADQHTDLLEEIFKIVRESAAYRDVKPRERQVNIVGLPWDAALEELSALLGEIGIGVNSCLLPEFDLETLRRYPAASLQVLSPHRAYEDFTSKVLEKTEMPTLKLDPPYGVRGTHRWLTEISDFFGLRPRFEKVWNDRWGRLSARFNEMRREAGGRRLGFVADAARLKKLRDCRWSSGIPVVPVLREMGFGLEWLVWCGCGSRRHAAKRSKETVRRFHAPAELSRLLRKEPIDAVYSDIFFDRRLSRAGKAQFSLPFFEPGLDGALRSFDRLLGVCRLPFFKDNASAFTPESPRAR